MRSEQYARSFKYPGMRAALDGNTAVILCERESSDAAGAYPITPSTQMGEILGRGRRRRTTSTFPVVPSFSSSPKANTPPPP